MKDILFPKWKDVIYELWEERKTRDINLVCLVASIGAGKSEVASVLQFLMIIELLSKYNPQKFYGLNPDSDIALINMSVTTVQARKITFGKVYPKVAGSPFFMDYFPPDPRVKRELRIPKAKISIFPGTSSEISALGFDLYGGCLTRDAEILTVDGSKRIDSLVNKKVDLYSFSESKDCVEKSTGTCISKGKQKVFEIELENGQKIKATENHYFLVRDGGNFVYKKLMELKEFDDLVTFCEVCDNTICPICGKEFLQLNSSHFVKTHGIDYFKVKEDYFYIPIVGNNQKEIMRKKFFERNPDGQVPNKIKFHSDEYKKKMSDLNKGKILSKVTCKRQSIVRTGRRLTEEWKENISKAVSGGKNGFYGRKHTVESINQANEKRIGITWEDRYGKEKADELRKEMSERFCGDKNVHWNGGVSWLYKDYGGGFTKELKNYIKNRDDYTCQLCNKDLLNDRIDVHHIDFDKLNNEPENLICLCVKCHSKVKNQDKRLYYIEYFMNKIEEKMSA
jgi:hypothetical protein